MSSAFAAANLLWLVLKWCSPLFLFIRASIFLNLICFVCFKDKFLLKHVKRNRLGYVSVKLLTSFKKVKNLSRSDWKITAYSLSKSDKLELNKSVSNQNWPLQFFLYIVHLSLIFMLNITPTLSSCSTLKKLNVIAMNLNVAVIFFNKKAFNLTGN